MYAVGQKEDTTGKRAEGPKDKGGDGSRQAPESGKLGGPPSKPTQEDKHDVVGAEALPWLMPLSNTFQPGCPPCILHMKGTEEEEPGLLAFQHRSGIKLFLPAKPMGRHQAPGNRQCHVL